MFCYSHSARQNRLNVVEMTCDGVEAIEYLSGEGKFADRVAPVGRPVALL